MVRFVLVIVTGWMAVIGVGIEVSLPYLLRNTTARTSPDGPPQRAASLRTRLWPHYWIGYALVALILMHASFVMGPAVRASDTLGLWSATLALCVLFVQVGIGVVLKSAPGNQRQVRGWHFWSMVIFSILLTAHLLRNT